MPKTVQEQIDEIESGIISVQAEIAQRKGTTWQTSTASLEKKEAGLREALHHLTKAAPVPVKWVVLRIRLGADGEPSGDQSLIGPFDSLGECETYIIEQMRRSDHPMDVGLSPHPLVSTTV